MAKSPLVGTTTSGADSEKLSNGSTTTRKSSGSITSSPKQLAEDVKIVTKELAQIQILSNELKKQTQSNTELINLGFLIIAITTLGIAIAFLQLLIEVCTFLRNAG